MIPAPIIRTFIAPLWAWHERSPYFVVAKKLKAQEKMSLDERTARQWTLLVKLVRHAWENCPYYRKRFSEAGFAPEDLKTWEDFRRLPGLTKDEILANSQDMISRTADRSRLVPRKTSGSTGVSLNFFVDDAEFQFKRGATLYRDQWTGWRIGEWRAAVWGNPTYLHSLRGRARNAFLERIFSLDTLKMDESMMHGFSKEILRRKPTLLFGHAHSLYLFGGFWAEHGYSPYRFRGIISTAMVLHDFERRRCEEVFGSRIFDRYGCEEVSLIASECEVHSGLHINTDCLVVEVLAPDGDCLEGQVGEVVVTDLHNYAMPFIRYKVGDMAVLKAGLCPCGRTYPMLGRVAGRVADYLRTPDGHWVSGISLTENFATLISGVRQVQIVQKEIDLLHLRLVPAEDFGEDSLNRIRALVEERFGPRMRHQLELVDKIVPEPSGKYRFSIYSVGDRAATDGGGS